MTFGSYMDADADAVTPCSNTRSYILRSVPSSPGRSFLNQETLTERSSCNQHAVMTRFAVLHFSAMHFA